MASNTVRWLATGSVVLAAMSGAFYAGAQSGQQGRKDIFAENARKRSAELTKLRDQVTKAAKEALAGGKLSQGSAEVFAKMRDGFTRKGSWFTCTGKKFADGTSNSVAGTCTTSVWSSFWTAEPMCADIMTMCQSMGGSWTME